MTDLANVLAIAVQVNREMAARSMEVQNREWRQIAGDRRDVEQIEARVKEPNLPRIAREADDRRRDLATRSSEEGKKGTRENTEPPTKYKDKEFGIACQIGGEERIRRIQPGDTERKGRLPARKIRGNRRI